MFGNSDKKKVELIKSAFKNLWAQNEIYFGNICVVLNCESHETVSFIRNMTRRGYENRNVSKIETDISFFDPSVSFMKRFSLFKKNPFHQMWETERFLIVIIHIFHFEHLGNSSIIGQKGKTNLSERSKSWRLWESIRAKIVCFPTVRCPQYYFYVKRKLCESCTAHPNQVVIFSSFHSSILY